MRLNLSSFRLRWIFAACLAGLIFVAPFQGQETQQAPPPSQPPPATQQEAQPEPPVQEGQQETIPPKEPTTQLEPSPQPEPRAQAQDSKVEVEVNDRTRTFVVHLPQGYDSQQHYPVVILLHGLDQDASDMARLTHFNEFADQDGIIAVYPNALRGRWNRGGGEPRPYRRDPYRRPGAWGPGYPPQGPRQEPGDRREGAHRNPDIQFLNRMLDKIATRYSVDTRRIYAAGLGEGGFMAIRLGCSTADRIAAIAIVGAAMPRMLNCVPSRPISVLLINGTDDPIVPFEGGQYKDGMAHLLSAEESARHWAQLNRCSEKASESKLPALQEGGKDTSVYLFNACPEGTQVALYGVKGGGHTWPGGEQYLSEKEVGKTSAALNANETIWGFLVTRKIAGESGVEK